jgi:phosphatidylglycerol---prolipoprotein diacylglyceryl transferase
MIIHNFDPILIDFGLFQVRWYSIAYIAGILIGWIYAIKIIKITDKNTFDFKPIKKEHFDDLIIYLVLGIIVGGRLGYVIFYNLEYYIQNFFEIFKVWQGGMSFHGGLFGVILFTFIFSKKTNTNFFKFTDIICCVAPIGIFLGRIANFINSELFGKISDLPWAVIFPNGGDISRHPSQIYEAFLEGFILFVLINFLALKKQILLKTGYISGLFLIFYSIARIIGESFREPDIQLGYFFNYFSMGVILSSLTFLVGCLIIFSIKNNEKNY